MYPDGVTRTRALLLGAFVVMFLSAGVGAQTPHRSLAGRLLVATDAVNDTRFERAVIYMVRLYGGGPVGERRGFVLHTPDWTGEGTEVVDRHFALTEPCAASATQAGGSSTPMKTGAWGVALADERLVFDEDPKQKWIEAMSRRLLDL